jgi:hypothetical protein
MNERPKSEISVFWKRALPVHSFKIVDVQPLVAVRFEMNLNWKLHTISLHPFRNFRSSLNSKDEGTALRLLMAFVVYALAVPSSLRSKSHAARSL